MLKFSNTQIDKLRLEEFNHTLNRAEKEDVVMRYRDDDEYQEVISATDEELTVMFCKMNRIKFSVNGMGEKTAEKAYETARFFGYSLKDIRVMY